MAITTAIISFNAAQLLKGTFIIHYVSKEVESVIISTAKVDFVLIMLQKEHFPMQRL